jgi:hypothetical protein
MRIRDIIGEAIATACLFGLLYAGFMWGLGMGWI